jgi:hypothetical protein
VKAKYVASHEIREQVVKSPRAGHEERKVRPVAAAPLRSQKQLSTRSVYATNAFVPFTRDEIEESILARFGIHTLYLGYSGVKLRGRRPGRGKMSGLRNTH